MGRQESRYKFYWQGRPDGTAGVGMLVSEKWIDHVVNVDRINEQALIVKLVVESKLVNILSVYAPQAGRPQEEKDALWDSMHIIVSRFPDNEVVILGGNLNSHVGRIVDGYGGVHGGMGFGRRNPEREAILEFGDAMGMMVGNTFFWKPDSHLITYESGGSKIQINYIMVRATDWAMVRNVKVIAREECVTQHRLVGADLRVRTVKRSRRKFKPKLRIWELSKKDVWNRFVLGVEARGAEVQQAEGTEMWLAMKRVWLEVVSEGMEKAWFAIWKETGYEGDHELYR